MSWITCTLYICTYSPCHNTHYCLAHYMHILCSIHEVSGQLIEVTSFTDMLHHSLIGACACTYSVHVLHVHVLCCNTLPKVMEDEGVVYSEPAIYVASCPMPPSCR